MNETPKRDYIPPILERFVFKQVVGVSIPIGANTLSESLDFQIDLPVREQ